MQRRELKSDITGSVWKVGDRVAQGEVLLVCESMKMEIPVEADRSGTVTEVKIGEGSTVSEGDVLVVIES